jgi:hypothetical protein
MCHDRSPRHGLYMGNDTLHVAGDGLADLATASFPGRRGYQATVVECDGHLPAGGPDSIFLAWPRPGFPRPVSRTTFPAARSGSCGTRPPTSWTFRPARP